MMYRGRTLQPFAAHNAATDESHLESPPRKLMSVGPHRELRQNPSERESIGQGIGGLLMDTRRARLETQPEVGGWVLSGCENVTLWTLVLCVGMTVCENVRIWVSLQVFLKPDPRMPGSHMVSIPRPFALPVGSGEAAVSPGSHRSHAASWDCMRTDKLSPSSLRVKVL